MTRADLLEISADVFKPMDGGIALSPDEVKGRNDWILWTAGNPVFWDRLARSGFGLLDLLKTLDSRTRSRRFAEMGLVNEPGFREAAGPDQFGLWLDEPLGPTPVGIDERIYGRSSGVVGLRIFPNPDFDDRAKKRWDAQRYYADPYYYTDPDLVRPYRVGVACGLCHVGFNPLVPPADPGNPRWENLASAIGNQYIREGKVFTLAQPGSFFWEMLNAQPPGTSDTSRAASDHINNPSAINGIFLLGARLAEGSQERLSGGALDWPGDAVRSVPHILKDGADSVGAAGAMMRVYVNEGLYSQQWLRDHDLLLGLRPQTPFSIAAAFRNSVYWQATYERTDNIVKFFMRLGPMRLKDAPGGSVYISTDSAVTDRGRIVFAENCAMCHSSKQPGAELKAGSPQWRDWYRRSVMSANFLDDNFLSTDKRYPVARLKTNACRALATNAAAGHIWDNFSSETYKALPSVGMIATYNPFDEANPLLFDAPAGGPGYYRPPSLAAIWSSAPFLHNNSVGTYSGDPSVAGRMKAFDDAIHKLLWPERRAGMASISRTTRESYLKIPEIYLPGALKPFAKDGYLSIGPIPKGTPINLLANLDPSLAKVVKLVPRIAAALLSIAKGERGSVLSNDSSMRDFVASLLSASNCPDLVEDRGHEFGSKLPDDDKMALIEFLKTF